MTTKRLIHKPREQKNDAVKKEFERVVKIPLACAETPGRAQRMSDLTWRIFRIMAEFIEGFEFLSKTCREVTFFGSARLKSTSHWYKEAEKLAGILAQNNFAVISGGGPGIMEAANKGAFENGGDSIGINIQLPTEQRINPYVLKSMGFHYFFTRKVMLAASAQAYIFFPGGFGTLDEFFEIITLIQTKKMAPIVCVCVGSEFWGAMDSFVRQTLQEKFQTIEEADRSLYHIVDTAEEAFELVKDSKERTIF